MENKKEKHQEVATINELAIIMRDSFQANQEYMDKKFDAMEKKFDDKIEALDQKFEQKFDQINYRLDKIDIALDGQEKVVFGHENRLDSLEVEVTKLKKAPAL